jgi:hypothetical protein
MLLQQISKACARIKQGTPSAEDYKLIFQYPGMAAMFMRKY